MSQKNTDRRNFGRLAAIAAGGLVVGSRSASAQEPKQDLGVDPALLIAAPNVCKGLNTCKGEGKGTHDCAGQSSCASVAAHECAGTNACKGQGGCGGYPGQNTCESKGSCGVPLKPEVAKLARKQFEQLMKAAGKKIGSPA